MKIEKYFSVNKYKNLKKYFSVNKYENLKTFFLSERAVVLQVKYVFAYGLNNIVR